MPRSPESDSLPGLFACLEVGLDLVPESLDNLVSTREAADICNVSCDLIRKWAHRGQLEPAGIDDFGRPLYKLIDVLRCSRDRRNNAGFGPRRIA